MRKFLFFEPQHLKFAFCCFAKPSSCYTKEIPNMIIYLKWLYCIILVTIFNSQGQFFGYDIHIIIKNDNPRRLKSINRFQAHFFFLYLHLHLCVSKVWVLEMPQKVLSVGRGVGAVVRSLPSNPKVPGSIPGSAESGIFGDLLSR